MCARVGSELRKNPGYSTGNDSPTVRSSAPPTIDITSDTAAKDNQQGRMVKLSPFTPKIDPLRPSASKGVAKQVHEMDRRDFAIPTTSSLRHGMP